MNKISEADVVHNMAGDPTRHYANKVVIQLSLAELHNEVAVIGRQSQAVDLDTIIASNRLNNKSERISVAGPQKGVLSHSPAGTKHDVDRLGGGKRPASFPSSVEQAPSKESLSGVREEIQLPCARAMPSTSISAGIDARHRRSVCPPQEIAWHSKLSDTQEDRLHSIWNDLSD